MNTYRILSRSKYTMPSSGRRITAGMKTFYRQQCSIVALLLSTSRTLSFSTVVVQHGPFSKAVKMSHRPGSERLLSNDSFVEGLKQAYEESETDGVLSFVQTLDASRLQVSDIVTASLEVSGGSSGDTASILNAWLGSCCLMEDQKISTKIASGLIDAYQELQESRNITPDLVAYSLAYSVFCHDPTATHMAEYVLDQAIRKSKKIAGGRRRKTLAASKRKGKVLCVSDIEEDLRQSCGEDFSVLYETDEFLVINKPSGIPCFHRKTTTAGKIRKGKGKDGAMADDISIEDALICYNVQLSTLNPDALGLVHRLDRGSSGCLVLAKTDEMHAMLVAEFFLRRTEKRYKTIVAPPPDQSLPTTGEITAPVDGRPAKSVYKIVQRYGDVGALLEFEIYTGRKHQIRVHASEELSSPVYMDIMYGGTNNDSDLADTLDSKKRFLLHAAHLRVPAYGIDVEAPLPKWWETVITSFRENTF